MEYGRDNGSHYDFTCCKYDLYRYGYKCRLYSYCQQHGYSYAIAYAKHQRYKCNLCGRKYDAHRFGRQLLFMEYWRNNGSHYAFACLKYDLYGYGYFGWLFCHCQQHRNSKQ